MYEYPNSVSLFLCLMCLVPVPTFETSEVLNNNYSFKQFAGFNSCLISLQRGEKP